MKNRLVAGTRMSDVDGGRLRGIPSLPSPLVVVPGPARRTAKNAVTLPQSIRYLGKAPYFRYLIPDVVGFGNRQRNCLPADVWFVGNRYNKTAVYRPPTSIANPTWRIANLTKGDIERVEKMQQKKRQNPSG